jgi:hypothetical protein
MVIEHDIQKGIGVILETTFSFSSITSSYTTFKNLGGDLYKNIAIKNDTDNPIILRFTDPRSLITYTLTVDANDRLDFPSFFYNGIIEIKYVSSACTSGIVRMWNW